MFLTVRGLRLPKHGLGISIGIPQFALSEIDVLNQEFYHSSEWQSVRDRVIIRDNGCDLGIEGYDIKKNLYIHHMNPVSEADLIHRMDYILDPEYLICVSLATHNAIHYGNDSYLIASRIVERKKGDTCPWIVS